MPVAGAGVRYLFSLLGAIRKEHFGLGRMEVLMKELGHPECARGIVHIAGTNGKGSVAAMIESGLRAGGRSTGLYTSPHLVSLRERFLLNGQPVDDEALEAAIEPVRRASERVVTKFGGRMHPTFFESVTAVGLVLFSLHDTDFRIVETGLGGRLDASNVVRSDLAVLTRIARDHERYLGRELESIAAEKAAIVKAGGRAVIGLQKPQARQVLLRRCEAVEAEAVDVESEWRARAPRSIEGRWRFEAVSRPETLRIALSLAGEHQVENALAAIAALRSLGVRASHVEEGLASAVWPGRLEFSARDSRVLLDAAHNPQAARALARFLRMESRGRKVTLIFGSSRDKAVEEVAGWLYPVADRVVLTRSKVQRAASPAALQALTGHLHSSIEVAPNVADALTTARTGAADDRWIVVAGSLFLVGEARAMLG